MALLRVCGEDEGRQADFGNMLVYLTSEDVKRDVQLLVQLLNAVPAKVPVTG